MKVFFRGHPGLFFSAVILFVSAVSSGCLVEKERNPGAKAAQRAAERRQSAAQARVDAEKKQGEANAVAVTSRAAAMASSKTSELALTIPASTPHSADQLIVVLEPMVAKTFDCSTHVAKRTLDHYNGEMEIAGASSIVTSYGVDTNSVEMPVIYKEVFDVHAGEIKIYDIVPGAYRLTLELRDGATGLIYQRGATDVNVVPVSTSDVHVELRNLGLVEASQVGESTVVGCTVIGGSDGHDSASYQTLPADLKPYFGACPSGRVTTKVSLYHPRYDSSVAKN